MLKLDLEFDDLLDPSLPRLYTPPSDDEGPYLIGEFDFTDCNPVFRDVQVSCPVQPARLSLSGEKIIMDPSAGVPRGILSRHALVCPVEWNSTVKNCGLSDFSD
jgi:hypothetical protein